MKKQIVTAVLAASMFTVAGMAQAAQRDTINIVGSSTVFPFATVVAENFGKETKFNTPKIESTGSGGGMKLFCAGTGVDTPDVTNASRRMKKKEFELCVKNGVDSVTEVLIGFDGIAIANSKAAPQMDLTRKDIFLALAKEVPDAEGKLIPNPYKTWKEVNRVLPDTKIEVLGPPPTSGTRDAFVELVMEAGAKAFPDLKALRKSDKKAFKKISHAMREDGAFIEAGENDNLIVQKLEKNPDALGIFGYSFLEQNSDKVQGSKIDGLVPEFETIASGEYKVSRPLYFYVKNAHVGKIPGIKEYIERFTSEDAIGEEGYLLDKGLIPLAEEEQAVVRTDANSLKKLVL